MKLCRLDWFLGLLLVLSTLIAYSQVRHFDFVGYDDPEYVSENAIVRAGLTSEGIVWALTSTSAANWFPLTRLSHMLDCQWFGSRSGMHHLTNLALHILTTLLLFAAFRRMTRSRVPSAIVALLFALHPLHVESVAWVSERKDVLSAFFCLLGLWSYARYAEAPALGRYVTIAAAFCLGLMSKPMLVTFPFLLLLLDVWPLGRRESASRLIFEKLPLLILSAAASVITLIVQRGGGAVPSMNVLPFGTRMANAVISYVTYLGQTFWPANLAIFYPYPASFPLWRVAGAGLVLAGITAFAVASIRRRPCITVGWLWFLGTLIPVIGLVQVGMQAHADRYTYLPSIGLFAALVWGGAEMCRKLRRGTLVGLSLAALASFGCFVGTWHQLQFWRDSRSLFGHAIAVTTGNYMALNILGEILLLEGRNDDAFRYLSTALSLNPAIHDIHTNLGTIFLRRSRIEDAISEFTTALTLKPTSAEAHCGLGLAYEAQGSMDSALIQLGEAVRIKPDYADARYNLGRVYAELGRTDEAISQFKEAIRIDPGHISAHYNLGTALGVRGNLSEAASEFALVIRLKPDYADAHNNLGTALAGLGRYDEAIVEFKEALRLDPNSEQSRTNLENVLSLKTGK